MNSYSTDNGSTWSDWNQIAGAESNTTVNPFDVIPLEEGTGNLVRWQAEDLIGNGPSISDEYRILVDTKNVTFSDAKPLASDLSTTENVELGITISDTTSGVNASSLVYSISFDNGSIWGDWPWS